MFMGNERLTPPTFGWNADIEREVVAGVWAVDRVLWRKELERNLRRSDSQLYRNVPRYGPKGAGLVGAEVLWLWAAGLTAILGTILGSVLPSYSASQIAAYVLWALGAIFLAVSLAHAVGAAAEGKHYRASRPA